MTDTYKVLGQALTGELAQDGTTVKETLVYEVPEGTKASVSAIEITNSDIANQTYKIAFVPRADVSSAVSSISVEEVVGTELVGVPTVVGTEQIEIGRSYDNYFVRFIAGNSTYSYSSDGYTWSIASTPYTMYNDSFFSAGGRTIVRRANYSNQIMVSSNLLNWTTYTVPWIQGKIAGGGLAGLEKFAYVTNGSEFCYSSDAITWTTAIAPLYNILSIDYANGLFFFRGTIGSGETVMYVTSDFQSFTQASFGPNGINNFIADIDWNIVKLVHNGSRYMTAVFPVGGNQTELYTSTDGINWGPGYQTGAMMSPNAAYNFGKFTFLEAVAGNFIFGVTESYAEGINGIWQTDGVSTSSKSSLTKSRDVTTVFGNYNTDLNLIGDYGFIIGSAIMYSRPWPSNGDMVYNVLAPFDQGSTSISQYYFTVQNRYDDGNGYGMGPVGASFILTDQSAQAKADLAAWVNALKTSGYSMSEMSFNFQHTSPIEGLPGSRSFNGNLYIVAEYDGNWNMYRGSDVSMFNYIMTPNVGYGYAATGIGSITTNIFYQQQDIIEIVYETQNVLGLVSYPILQSLNKHLAIYNKSIASGETHEIKGGITLSAGDQIRVYSTSNEIITNVYGVEIA